MIRLATLVAATLISAPALAGSYSAVPSSAEQPSRVVTRDIAWSFAGGAFKGQTEQSRPIVLCQALAKKVGPLSSFSADGRAFSAAELGKCNGLANGGAAVANAN